MTGSASSAASAPTARAAGLARIPVQPDRTVSCRGCGATTTCSRARVTGAWSVQGDLAIWHCGACTRALLADFESGRR